MKLIWNYCFCRLWICRRVTFVGSCGTSCGTISLLAIIWITYMNCTAPSHHQHPCAHPKVAITSWRWQGKYLCLLIVRQAMELAMFIRFLHMLVWQKIQSYRLALHFARWQRKLSFDNCQTRMAAPILQLHFLPDRFALNVWFEGIFFRHWKIDVKIYVNLLNLASLIM